MLKTTLLHPEILETLAAAGHGSRVLIADGNYPFSTGSSPQAKRVFLNLAPGLLTVPDVLKVLITAIPVEAAFVMDSQSAQEPAILGEFRQLLPELELQKLERFAFYDAARSRDVALVVATGEQRVYANILLTIGVVK
ncbi:MAG: RbsD/FucU family protein [Anaerolineae bacterium]